MNLVYFLGRLHVVVLHLPIGVVLVTLAIEWLARRERFRPLAALTPILWWAAAGTAVLTALLGLLHAQEGIVEPGAALGSEVRWHRAFGISFAIAVVGAAMLRNKLPEVYRVVRAPVSVALLILVTLTGHYGGNITHGSSYLVEYAPAPVRWLASVPQKRTIVTDPAKADAYLDVVQPIFDEHCVSCHSDVRKKGGLSLVSRERLMKGGKDGAVIVAGDPKASELYRRVTLPAADEHAMPAQGKTPLSAADRRKIEWWIAGGAPAKVTVAQLGGIGDSDTAILDRSVASHTAGAAAKQASTTLAAQPNDAPAHIAPASPETLAKLAALGFVIRPVAQNNPLLDVAFTKGQHVDAATFPSLLSIKSQIAELNLRSAGLTDAQLQVIAQIENLEHLRVELNDITDSGVRSLASLTKLRSLNLYGTRVTDASLETLAHMPSLQHVYLFQTAATRCPQPEQKLTSSACGT